jgi:hypothetical protein
MSCIRTMVSLLAALALTAIGGLALAYLFMSADRIPKLAAMASGSAFGVGLLWLYEDVKQWCSRSDQGKEKPVNGGK